jgi:hypothetical protein
MLTYIIIGIILLAAIVLALVAFFGYSCHKVEKDLKDDGFYD